MAGYADVWDRYIGSQYQAAAFGLTGDRSHNLMWRLMNGELPVLKTPKLVVVLIGEEAAINNAIL